MPVDLFIPGCPPHPLTILDGLLRLLDRLEQKSKCREPVEQTIPMSSGLLIACQRETRT